MSMASRSHRFAGPGGTVGSTTGSSDVVSASNAAVTSGAGGGGADAEGDEGCGCRAAGAPGAPREAALGGGLLALLVARLRRGRRSPS